MIVRRSQLDTFAAQSARQFKNDLLGHIRRCFPRDYSRLGDSRARAFVDAGVDRARHHGFVSKKEICGLVDLMLIFGPQFDDDSRIPWARAILNNRSTTEAAKMQALIENADAFLRSVSGDRVSQGA
jgi:hypothetical protein